MSARAWLAVADASAVPETVFALSWGEELRVETRMQRFIDGLNTERLGLLDVMVSAAVTGTLDSGDRAPLKIRGYVPWTKTTTDYNRYYDLLIESFRSWQIFGCGG